MRILLIANLYPDSRQPSFGTFIAGHADALRRAGAVVSVVAIRGVPVHRAVLAKYLWLSLRAVGSALRARLLRSKPHIVEAHVAYPTALVALVAARIAGAALVVYCHGSDVTGRALRSPTHHAIARWLFSRADLIVVNSAFIRELVETHYGVPSARVSALPPGVDLSAFSGPSLGRQPKEILYVGRLSTEKGVHELMRAVADLGDDEVSLRLVGDGPERRTLEQAASRVPFTVDFTGPLSPADVAHVMRQAAVLAVPSTYPEGLGLVALEGMAAGAMVVATAVGGLPESVENGRTGWLVPPGDVAALSTALREALAVASEVDPARRVALQERALATVREHDIDAIARRTLDVYASLGVG